MDLNQIAHDIIQITEKHGCTYSDAERETLSKQISRCVDIQFRQFNGPLARRATDTPQERDKHYTQFVKKLLNGSCLEPDDITTEFESALYEINRIFEVVKNLTHPPLVYIVQGFMHQAKAGKFSLDQAYDNFSYAQLYNASAAREAQLTLQQWNAIELDYLKVLLDIKDEYQCNASPELPLPPTKKPRQH